MPHTRWLAAAAEIGLAGVAAVGLFAAGDLLPVLGVAAGVLFPVPLVLLRLRQGWPALVLGLILAGLAVAWAVSPRQAAVFLLEFGLAALLLAEGMRRAGRPEGVVTGIATLLTLGGIASLVLSSDQWSHPLSAVRHHVEALLADLEAFSARVEAPGDPSGALTWFVGTLRRFLPMGFPGIVFAGSLLTAAGQYLLLGALIRRRPALAGGLTPEPFRWELPELLVWAFIGAGLLCLSDLPWLKSVGLNGLVVLISLYFLQGLSIAAFFFQRFQVPRLLAALSVLLLLSLPILPLLVAGLGLFDVWFAFRRLSFPKTPRQT